MFSLDSLLGVPASRGRFAALVTAVFVTTVLIALGFYSASERVVAGDGPKIIRGFIYDAMGNPLAGANVTVEDLNGAGPGVRETLWYDSSESDGFYTVNLNPLTWQIGDTIRVTGKYDGHQAINSTVATSGSTYPIQYVNVTMSDVTIPEFGGFAGSMAFVSIMLIATVVVLRRRRSSI